MSWVLPVGLDSADGETLLPAQPIDSGGAPRIVGTPLPTADFQIWGTNGGYFVQEQPGSPRIERAEQCTCEHRVKVDKSSGLYYFANMPRGTVVTDTGANIWRILLCEYERESDLCVTLHYVMESLSFDSPLDDFSIHASSLDLNIIKYPRYWRWLCPYAGDSATISINDIQVSITILKEAIIRMIQNYIESPFFPTQNQTNSLIQVNIINALNTGSFQFHYANPTFKPDKKIVDPVVWSGKNSDIPSLNNPNCAYYLIPSDAAYAQDDPDTGPIHMAIAAAKELISKLWRQEDTPYLVGYDVVWTQYFFQPVWLNPGGYQEDPRDWIPSYFMSPGLNWPPTNLGVIPGGDQTALPTWQPGTGNADSVAGGDIGDGSIFDQLVSINPQSYSSDGTTNGDLVLSSLREADDFDYERTWFKVPHKWKVAPVGKWDSDLYLQYGEDAPQQVSDFNENPINAADI